MPWFTAFAVVLVLSLVSAEPSPPAVRPLDVYWIDVEGGAATLIVTPAGESILIDAGNPGGRDAARIHKVATEEAGLRRIDHLIVTHLHRDHFGGVAELAALMPVGSLHENGIETAPESERSQQGLDAYRGAQLARRARVQPGDVFPLVQAPGAAPLRLRVLAARQAFAPGAAATPNAACRDLTEQPPDASDNANSIVTILELGAFRFFDGGDLTWNVEGRLVCPDDRVGVVDVFQSEHHGLDQSNNPLLVRTLQPRVVVFNNGARKGYEARSSATVKATASVQAVYQMHRSVRSGAENTQAERIANADEACAGNHIRLSVAPDGNAYTVFVPATGHRQTYEVGSKR